MEVHPSPVSMRLTGFGPFGDVQVNPSGILARQVARGLEEQGHTRVQVTELETSVAAVAAYFDALQAELEGGEGDRILLLHLGVHSREEHGILRLEVRGYNELSANLPDVRGRQFQQELICAEDGPLDHYLESIFFQPDGIAPGALADWVEQRNHSEAAPVLTSAEARGTPLMMPSFQPPRWEISRDAHRYLCNCCLYRSLRLQEAFPGRVFSLFVHVVDPTKGTRGEAETDGMSYNPTLMTQTKELSSLAQMMLGLVEAYVPG